MSRFLLEPCNNTLSHVAKCLALREALEACGHEVFLAVSVARAAFLERIGQRPSTSILGLAFPGPT